MAQHGGDKSRASTQKGTPERAGESKKGPGEQQQKGMGAHPAYGDQPADSPPAPRRAGDEDYGAQGLHRQAGTTKGEGFEKRGIGHAEDYDARYDADSSKPRDEARAGRAVVSGQDTHERDAAKAGRTKAPNRGYSEIESDTGQGDLDISPGAAGGSKNSKRDPASR